MTVYIFTGPTLPAKEAQNELDAIYLPPVSQGDVYRVTLRKPEVIGIIDGYFERIPSVWHKEILWALYQGIHVYGSASMGALRASELYPFGMVGVGVIFEAFRDEILEDDDEVAVIHGPPEAGYRPFSEAMVNIRSTIEAAAQQGIISTKTAEALKNLAKLQFYQERTYPNLFKDAKERGLPAAELKALQHWLPRGHVDQKRLDAIDMLRRIRADRSSSLKRKEVSYHFEYTYVWDQFWRKADSLDLEEASSSPLLVDDLLEEICLVDGGWKRLKTGTLMRLLAIRESRQQGFELTTEQLEGTADDYRIARNLYKPEDLEQWLECNCLTRDDFIRLLEDEARISWIEAIFHSDIVTMLPDYLRSTGEYEVVLARAQEKRRLLEEHGLDQLGLEAAEFTEAELLRWYFEERLELSVPSDLEAKAKEMGFADGRALKRAALNEWHYLDLVEDRAQLHQVRRVSLPDRQIPAPEAGDPAPPFTLPCSEFDSISLDRLAGRPTLLVFISRKENLLGLDPLKGLSDEHDVQVVCILPWPYTAESIPGSPLIPLFDADRVVYRRYGIQESGAILLDAGHRVVKAFSLVDGARFSRAVLESIYDLRDKDSGLQAPVLIVPNVLDLSLSKKLIQLWQTGGNQTTGVVRLTPLGAKDVVDDTIKRRRDHFIQPGQLEFQLHEIFARRVHPELRRAFHFDVQRCEQLRIGCYDSAEEGHFRAHRDNTNPATAQRRYSLSINLNTGEYDGGGLWFPEYGLKTYCPDSGNALVFSSSLMHEVMSVRSGVRFVLITHFYGTFDPTNPKAT